MHYFTSPFTPLGPSSHEGSNTHPHVSLPVIAQTDKGNRHDPLVTRPSRARLCGLFSGWFGSISSTTAQIWAKKRPFLALSGPKTFANGYTPRPA